ncbi:MAG: hypothetical protein M0C28_46415 [Candidatus Moduliflexus flocculans]|nr:hypothetical protein [Candidatus Moduliflexus flocculans]
MTSPVLALFSPYSHERQDHPFPGPELGNRPVRAPEDPRSRSLALAVEGSPLERYVRRLRREMEAKRFRFKPEVYLTDGWGCPDRTPVIGIPFYLADPRLARLEEEQTGEVEDPRTIMMLLRHEAGHAVNYAYRLWRRPELGRDLRARSPSPTGTPSGRTG